MERSPLVEYNRKVRGFLRRLTSTLVNVFVEGISSEAFFFGEVGG